MRDLETIVHASVTTGQPCNPTAPYDRVWDVTMQAFTRAAVQVSPEHTRRCTLVYRVSCTTRDMALPVAIAYAIRDGWRPAPDILTAASVELVSRSEREMNESQSQRSET